jgi:hypothetical protein
VSGIPKGDYHAERIVRLVELANGAQDAADHVANTELRETYLRLANQWAGLASLAELTAAAESSRRGRGRLPGNELH